VKNMAIARRYAKALLLIGKQTDQAEAYRDELDGVASVIQKNPDLAQTLENPLYGAADRKKVLEKIIGSLPLSDVMRAFLLLLFDKGRISFLAAINDFYQRLADDLKGIARATLVSASALSAETIDKIQASLSERTGKQVALEVEKNPDLIGGIVTRIGDLVLDGSIRTQLQNMRETLKRGESV